MRWLVKDTSKLKDYGFELKPVYDEDERITAWMYEVAKFPLSLWIEVYENDVNDKDEVLEAEHTICLENAGAWSMDEYWEFYLPKLVELYNAGLLEVKDI